ncbi:MarR family winged helix-turn-helix transcriptional regulator [Bosea vaviloviae]|uniref:MarR family winged helix-turn-helix transcriptional regulator n=1 Tax=Bosea vaviloviae TaxID=1526658 RepID=UPI0020BF9B31|nr:MarR family transcriptional regulator [Bosea vaviloviae]
MDWKDGLTVERCAEILTKKMASDAVKFMRIGTRVSSILAGDNHQPPRPDTLAQTEKPERKSLAVGASHTFLRTAVTSRPSAISNEPELAEPRSLMVYTPGWISTTRVRMKSDRAPETAASPRRIGIDEVSDNKMAGSARSVSASRRRRSAQDADEGFGQTSTDDRSTRNSGFDQLNNRIFFRLFQLGNELQRQAVEQLGITTVQWAVLGALSQEKFASGIPLSDLGDYLVVTRQNLDGVLKRLERDELVRRVIGDGDKRARIVQLTPHGRKYWKEILERIYQFYDQASADFTFDERVALVHYLNVLQKDLGKVDLPKAGKPKRNGNS